MARISAFWFWANFHHLITKKVQGDSYKGILWKTSSKSHHQIIHKMELAEFGCRSDWKVEKLKNPAIFWQPAGTYMWWYQNYFLEIRKLLLIFSTNVLCMSHTRLLLSSCSNFFSKHRSVLDIMVHRSWILLTSITSIKGGLNILLFFVICCKVSVWSLPLWMDCSHDLQNARRWTKGKEWTSWKFSSLLAAYHGRLAILNLMITLEWSINFVARILVFSPHTVSLPQSRVSILKLQMQPTQEAWYECINPFCVVVLWFC